MLKLYDAEFKLRKFELLRKRGNLTAVLRSLHWKRDWRVGNILVFLKMP